jgi:rhodanese-related sulfurtransferase
MRNILFIASFLMVLASCQTKNESTEINSVNDVSRIDFTDENNVLLDVRTPEEFNEGNIPNSVNVDYNSEEFDSLVQGLDRNKTYYVYCQAGARSTKACAKLQEKGFENVVNLKDGYSAYKK